MRVLGIDPGSRFLGWGVVDVVAGQTRYAGHGIVRAPGDQPLPMRLLQIYQELGQVLTVFRPDAVAVEGVFTHKNARSALILGHARGVALLLAARQGLVVHEYAPARVKRSVGAGGNDGKGAVARMVTTLLKLETKLERSDAYDALAVALCHAHQFRAPRPGGSTTRTSKQAVPEGFAARLKPAFSAGREVRP